MASPMDESIFLWALKEVLNDPSFKTSSTVAADALQAASNLLHWCEDAGNQSSLVVFCHQLYSDPFTVLSERRPLTREKLWKSFWSVRSSTAFIAR